MRIGKKEPLIVEFDKDSKETKNAVRFRETDDAGYCGTVYILKTGHKKLGSPKKIRVTIEPL